MSMNNKRQSIIYGEKANKKIKNKIKTKNGFVF